ncbi:alpha-N-acetylgalactosaminidase-like [Daphnia pulex]|uniref:alpha-N-acetylgalactosaminidase-like n=1 Tax=Daphnia pulex TaxID=6669 RepID=UPI001EDEFAC2|nr:alpha-N-acetylgalactosaminidase-like [Daphnia pulex]XP_046438282.1 alpha-N-acetylgalactosaminidase-like [Daphnia pulex]XP_046438283.1 alpha-N-acetylgalactosaminidase-like [Daphnia pulex]
MEIFFQICLVILSFSSFSHCLDNGLALSPPMGWLAWQRFRCNTDCVNDPKHCISERLFMEMADLLVSEGYAKAGYNLISLDDCWLDKVRDSDGRLKADPIRFPSGIPALSDYIHSRGLRFGIYEDYGNYTCAGYPGILNNMKLDAQTFADWKVDYVKLDGCYSFPSQMDKGYPEFGYYLNRTGRSMIYSCSWPFYQLVTKMEPDYATISKTCNLWRNFEDIQDSWQSVTSIIDYYGDNQDTLIPLAGPGHWNDPDMLIIGNFGLSYEQSRAQMCMWAIMASPLLMSVDLRTIRPEFKAILLNTEIIAVNQDPLGVQGRRVYKKQGIEIWTKPVLPKSGQRYSWAIVVLNRRVDGTPSQVTVPLRELGLDSGDGYHVRELNEHKDVGIISPDQAIQVDVNPSGVAMLKCTIIRVPPFTP